MVGARRRIAALLAAAAAASLLGACGASANHPTSTPTTVAPTTSAPTTSAPTTGAPTTSAPPTTTLPPDLQPSAADASAAFIDAWKADDRGAAAKVATATAVATLFAGRYSGEILNDRGCTVPGVNDVVCSWGPYAEASPTNPLYQVTVSPHGAAWYVSSVVKLG